MFMTPGERLTPWVLLIKQESYLPYIKGHKKDIGNYRPISLFNLVYKIILLIHKNQMQKTLVNIIGKHQLEAIKNVKILVYTLFLLFLS